jgi:hypothetical protein
LLFDLQRVRLNPPFNGKKFSSKLASQRRRPLTIVTFTRRHCLFEQSLVPPRSSVNNSETTNLFIKFLLCLIENTAGVPIEQAVAAPSRKTKKGGPHETLP